MLSNELRMNSGERFVWETGTMYTVKPVNAGTYIACASDAKTVNNPVNKKVGILCRIK